jgi:hypothetical protein
MPDTSRALNEYNKLARSLGKATLHTLFPNDFEYYSLSLELTTFDDNTIDYFAFPIMPKAISKVEAARINVKKTLSSVTVINSKSFIPQEISIKGNFGRAFKVLLRGSESTVFRAFRFARDNGVNNLQDLDSSNTSKRNAVFDPAIKTGYGCIKILQSIINKANGTDDKGRSFKLYLYNPALGESYLVVPTGNPLIFDQNDQQGNMIWSYTLNLTAIAPITGSRAKIIKGSLTNILAVDNVQKGLNSTASLVGGLLG